MFVYVAAPSGYLPKGFPFSNAHHPQLFQSVRELQIGTSFS
ncbi:unnamed protein product, partial [Litomosoides sigmodontis]